MCVITLLTDFGRSDGYAGILHGVILSICPAAVIVDVCHDIPPQDIHAAAFILSTVYPYFPVDTIHVIVVDPSVGSDRRALAVRTPRGIFVAPDNGVLSYVFARESILEMVHLNNSRYWLAPLSCTFHGRDLFAPVAAHLALGVSLSELGVTVQDPVRFSMAEAQVQRDGSISGEVLYVDRFGNLITNVSHELLPVSQELKVYIAGQEVIGSFKSYAQVANGELLAIIGSHGYLEVAMRNGNAAAKLNVDRGARVIVIPVAGST